MNDFLRKMIFGAITVLLSLSTLYSCADSQENLQAPDTLVNSIDPDSRSIQEAIAEADDFLGEIDDNATRSNTRRVASVGKT